MSENLNSVSSPIVSPIRTNLQDLPFEDLEWEKFERLCLALVQKEFKICDCEPLGKKGQRQYGIDIYARHNDDSYSVYQCKRYEKFTKSDLDSAILKFKQGPYFSKSKRFFICTACELNKTQVQNAFEIYKTEFKEKQIELIKWDKLQLSRLLKDEPKIVYDFFGQEYMKAFNGNEALSVIYNIPGTKINAVLKSASSDIYCIILLLCCNPNFRSIIFLIKRIPRGLPRGKRG